MAQQQLARKDILFLVPKTTVVVPGEKKWDLKQRDVDNNEATSQCQQQTNKTAAAAAATAASAEAAVTGGGSDGRPAEAGPN